MFLLIYELLWIFFDICSDLIEEKLLCWLLELLNMFGFNTNYILKNCGWWYVSLLHFICIMVVGRKRKIVEKLNELEEAKKWWWKVKVNERRIKKGMRSLVWKKKIYFGKTPNEECIWVWTHILWWKLENNSTLYDCVSHSHMHFI